MSSSTKDSPSLDWEAIAKQALNPVQISVLEHLAKGEPTSPKQKSVKLGLPIGNVSYHFSALRDNGLIEVVRTEPRRGAVEHFYALTGKAVMA